MLDARLTPNEDSVRISEDRSSLPSLAIRASLIHGKGCFAAGPIKNGEYIAEYLGQRISEAEALLRDDRSSIGYSPYIVHVAGESFIDGAVDGNEIRFINHSCNPNCDLVLDDDRVFIVAARFIEDGQELTIDYAFDRGEGFVCNCNAFTCRGDPHTIEAGEP